MQTSCPCALLVFAGSARRSEHLEVPAARAGFPHAAHQRGEGTRGSARHRLATVGAQTRRKETASYLSAAPVTRHQPRAWGGGRGALTLGSLERAFRCGNRSFPAPSLPESQVQPWPPGWEEYLSSPLWSPHLHLLPKGRQQLPNPCPFPQG